MATAGATARRPSAASALLDETLRSARLRAAFDEARLTPDQSRRVVGRIADRTRASARELTRLLVDGTIDHATWRFQMASGLRTAHEAAGMAVGMAVGGRRTLPAADRAALDDRIARQMTFLGRFAAELRSGAQPADGTALTRAGLYGQAVWAVAQSLERERAGRGGMDEERNVLGSADHCDGCLGETDRGWVALGELVAVGDRDCRANCRCFIEYR